jgi:predicted Zn-dependent protease
MIVQTTLYCVAKKSLKMGLSFSWVLSLIVPILIIEIACLNFPKVENIRSTEALITIVATVSMMSYDQLTYFLAITALDIYIYLRLYFRFGASVPYFRFNLFITCALAFVYVFSRALHNRYREDFILFYQQREMITIL